MEREALRAAIEVFFPGLSFSSDLLAVVCAEAPPNSAPSRLAELILCRRCVEADAHALTLLEQRYLVPFNRSGTGHTFEDEVIQRLREKLLLPAAGEPRLLAYSGTGELQSFIQAVALRISLTLKRRQNPSDGDETLKLLKSQAINPEDHALRQNSQDAFLKAFQPAFASLDLRERNLLRQHYIDALGTESLARLYRVDRTTAFRWLVRARQKLNHRIHAEAKSRLGLGRSELSSLVRAVGSSFRLSGLMAVDKE